MKKTLIITFIFGCMLSCSDEALYEEQGTNTSGKVATKNSPLGNLGYVGYSYDATAGYTNASAAKDAIIDMDAFEATYPDAVYAIGASSLTEDIYAGATFNEFLEELRIATGIKSDICNTDSVKFFSGSFAQTLTPSNTPFYSTRYSFAQVNITKRRYRYYINADASRLKEFLTDTFKEDVNTYTADDIVAKYGTHVLLDVSMGAHISFSYRSEISAQFPDREKKRIVAAGAKLEVSKMKAFTNDVFLNKEETEGLSKHNINRILNITYRGGDENGRSHTLAPKERVDTIPFIIGQWEELIDQKNASLVGVNWESAIPIYELIDNPTQKENVKDAFVRYLKSKQIEQIKHAELAPLIQWFNKDLETLAYTCDNDYDPGQGWVKHGTIAFVYPRKEDDSLPLIQWFNTKTRSHAYTCDANYDYGSDWEKHGTIAYIPKSNIEGAIPLFQLYCTYGRFYGYTIDSDYCPQGWVRNGIVGYVFR